MTDLDPCQPAPHKVRVRKRSQSQGCNRCYVWRGAGWQREHVPHGGIADGLCVPLEEAQAHGAENTSVSTTLALRRRPWAPWCAMAWHKSSLDDRAGAHAC